MERFQVPIFQASPALAKSPISVSVGASSLVSGIQQKLQANKTSSSQQESRIREVGSRAFRSYPGYVCIYDSKYFFGMDHIVCPVGRHLSQSTSFLFLFVESSNLCLNILVCFALMWFSSSGAEAGAQQAAANQWERLAEKEQFWSCIDSGGIVASISNVQSLKHTASFRNRLIFHSIALYWVEKKMDGIYLWISKIFFPFIILSF